MSQFKEREQTDSALYYYEPPQYFYEEGRSLKLRQTMGPFMVSFLFQCNPNNSHDLCEGTRMFQPQKKLHRWGPICRGKMGHFISSLSLIHIWGWTPSEKSKGNERLHIFLVGIGRKNRAHGHRRPRGTLNVFQLFMIKIYHFILYSTLCTSTITMNINYK